MKFVTLALALLLAVGSRAASLQADPPSQLDHIRSLADMYMTQVKESAKKALDGLDGTQYADFKITLAQRLDDMHIQIKSMQDVVIPVTDSVVSTISDATADFRASVEADIKALNTELEPMLMNLKTVLFNHIADYRSKLDPIVREYHAKHTAEMEELRTRLQPVVEELKLKVTKNVEETKAAVIPIVESVRAKLNVRLENLKEMATPYVEEYKDQIKHAVEQVKNIDPSEITALRERIQPMAEEVKTKLSEIFEAISATFSKS